MVPEQSSQRVDAQQIKDTCSILLHQFIDAAAPVATQLATACTFAALQKPSRSPSKVAGILRELENSLLTPCFSAYSQLGLRVQQRAARTLDDSTENDAIEDDALYNFLDTVFAHACHWLLVVRNFVRECNQESSSSTESRASPVNAAVKGSSSDHDVYFAIVRRLCRRIFGDAIKNRSYQLLATLRNAEDIQSNAFCDRGRRVAMVLWHALSCLSSCISVGDEILVVSRGDEHNSTNQTTTSSSHDHNRLLVVVGIDPWNDVGPVRLAKNIRETASAKVAKGRVETSVQFQDCTVVDSQFHQSVLCDVESEVWRFLTAGLASSSSSSDFGSTAAEVPNVHVGTKLDACWKLCIDIVTPFGAPSRSVQALAWRFSSHIGASLVKAQLYGPQALDDNTFLSSDAAASAGRRGLPPALLSLRKHACALLRAKDGSRTTTHGGIASRATTGEAPGTLWRRCLQRCGRIAASVSHLRDWLDLKPQTELLVSLALGLRDFVTRDPAAGGGNAHDDGVISELAMQHLVDVRRVLSEGKVAVHLSVAETSQVLVELDGIIAVLDKWQRVEEVPRLVSPAARTQAVALEDNESEDSDRNHSDESSQEF